MKIELGEKQLQMIDQALITMDITDAIQTAVSAGTQIRATVSLTTRPTLPTS